MKDINGKTARVGDKVAFIRPYSSRLMMGTVSKINPKTVTVTYINRLNDCCLIFRHSDQIAVVE